MQNKNKILKKQYRAVKDHNGKLGGGGKCARDLDNILGHRPASAPMVLLDTGTSSTHIEMPSLLQPGGKVVTRSPAL